jgi:hypothetical protein
VRVLGLDIRREEEADKCTAQKKDGGVRRGSEIGFHSAEAEEDCVCRGGREPTKQTLPVPERSPRPPNSDSNESNADVVPLLRALVI